MKKQFIQKLGFIPKENSNNIFIKKYKNNYILEIDFDKEKIDYGNKINSGRTTTQNFKDEENWVVLECVNRLLEKGYNPEDIELEKKFTVGHGASGGWLDILVKKDGKTFLMIECKTFGKEFEKELKNMQQKGGQLLSYFLQDRDADYLILYTSKISENYDFKKDYKNEIIVVEESYKEMSNLDDLYERWNKQTKENGIFENWVNSYKFESRALKYDDLNDIQEKDASYIFNRFLEILRHNTVSDKPNAFNKMFTLFLCKIYDEGDKQGTQKELEFQWIQGKDNNVDFQKRLTDLYKKGMDEFLSKQVTDFSDDDFEKQFGTFITDAEAKKELLRNITRLRLQKNNEFAIKEVFDEDSFNENAKVLKEIVELLQNYRFRYAKKQPFLGDFFELLLTTGLKQEAGQFFTPVPIARFICRSIPLENVIDKKLNSGQNKDILPAVIDYAAGSGHFLIESMEEIQKIIYKKDVSEYNNNIQKIFENWKRDPYIWAGEYIYGIEKDYRLVRTSKVGCYLHGDGIAQVIHGDGLDSFEQSKDYKGRLKKFDKDDKSQNEQFDFVLSNPPYSVSSFKGNMKREHSEKDFKLFNKLTDNSSEIEALFIERTSQLLKEGGIAGIILPSSILSNTGIYTKAREIILKDFEIIAITELGSNTFMATGTNTVTLFLRKRDKYFSRDLMIGVEKVFENKNDVTLNGIENAVSKYVLEVWEGLKFEDYKTILEKSPNEKILNHEIFKDYENKLKSKKQEDLLENILEIEKEKLFYFVLSYSQKVVLVKSGEKKTEKEFLGYEFSQRKGSEGIHPMQRGKQIDECTKLFDPNSFTNPQKASTYIFDAFNGDYSREISEEMKNHIFRTQLSDLLTFDRTDFEKTISLNLKKKVKIESKWDFEKLGNLIIENGKSKIKVGTAKDVENGKYKFFTSGESIFTFNDYLVDGKNIYLSTGGNAIIKKYEGKASYSTDTYSIKGNEKVLTYYLYSIFNNIIGEINDIYFKGQGLKHLQKTEFKNIKIPLPPKEIQQKIVDEIGELEEIEEENNDEIEKYESEIKNLVLNSGGEEKSIGSIEEELFAGGDLPKGNYIKGNNPTKEYNIPIYSNGLENDGLYGFTNKARVEKECITISARGTIGYPIERTKPFYPIVRLLVFIPKKEVVINKILVYSIKNLDLKQFGATTPQLTVPQFRNFKISLPPLEKQKEIVGKIEILEERIEKLKEENKNIPDKKKEILEKYL